ncbi:arginine vasopressin-induced protein 1 [Protopterus annectens]|uniref:arginine vasopressin-induced protein 1 n=1 Tax=Protopterus annectens TaxID=7888 RepID=UPI001CFA0F36|nr:arginine vasopressin-induced protein 1 [Protopterus annectens]XP_043912162.1 arginine vasopressin-induced protein 1 [Protopterus annectens]
MKTTSTDGYPASPAPCWRRSEMLRRKKAAADIFEDIDLDQMADLFRKTGDKKAEERARIIWELKDSEDIGEALMQLKGKKQTVSLTDPAQPSDERRHEFKGVLWLKAFSNLCIDDSKCRVIGLSDGEVAQSALPSQANFRSKKLQKQKHKIRVPVKKTKKRGKMMLSQDPARYLHQILH